MKVIRYVNGKKVQDLNVPDLIPNNSPVIVPPSTIRRVMQPIQSNPQPVPAQPNKGCGCGR